MGRQQGMTVSSRLAWSTPLRGEGRAAEAEGRKRRGRKEEEKKIRTEEKLEEKREEKLEEEEKEN